MLTKPCNDAMNIGSITVPSASRQRTHVSVDTCYAGKLGISSKADWTPRHYNVYRKLVTKGVDGALMAAPYSAFALERSTPPQSQEPIPPFLLRQPLRQQKPARPPSRLGQEGHATIITPGARRTGQNLRSE